ncbi:FAD-binding oxidoreductase [uncultured Limnobacter sp.]|uniref:FAD-binding oxidoreductase n=1 Tax=uncultured Limnobacter sp. TaxID=199681 RepID=UPI0030F4E801
MPHVLLRNGNRFTCEPHTTILDNAISNKIALEHSCKNGQCGVCEARVLIGETTTLKPEIGLSESKRSQGFVLTCCRAAISDLEIDAEDLPELAEIKTKTYPARIDSIQKLTPSIIKVVLRTPPSDQIKFLAGQYISVIGPHALRRSYSIANAPRSDGKIELHIKEVEGGAFSKYWFEQAKVNDLLRFEGPLGTFFARKPLPKKLLLLATGTGLAPIKAILEQIKNMAANELPEIDLYWGSRYEEDIYMNPADFSCPNLKTHLLLSQPSAAWAGRKGYVQEATLADHSNFKDCSVYACGSIKMIESAKAALLESGLPSNKFHSDAFVSSN